MTHIIDLLDVDHLEAGLRAGKFPDKEGFYGEVQSLLGRKMDKLETDSLRNSIFPQERRILTSLPQKRVEIDPELVAHRLGTECINGHKLEKPEDLYVRKGRVTCRACELARSAESKARARARARAERAKNPKPKKTRKPKVQAKRKPKKRVELTVQQVLEIRADYENNGEVWGWTARIAEKYNMSPEAIRAIAKRRTWKDV